MIVRKALPPLGGMASPLLDEVLLRDRLRASSAALVVSYGPLNFGTVSEMG
jgi:hypothetical protein